MKKRSSILILSQSKNPTGLTLVEEGLAALIQKSNHSLAARLVAHDKGFYKNRLMFKKDMSDLSYRLTHHLWYYGLLFKVVEANLK